MGIGVLGRRTGRGYVLVATEQIGGGTTTIAEFKESEESTECVW